MSLYKTFETDHDAEQEGILATYGNVRFLISRAGGSNKAYARSLRELSKPHRFALEHGKMSQEQSTELMAKVYARTIIKGWETLILDEDGEPEMVDGEYNVVPTIENKDGEMLEFNEKNCIQVLVDLPDLFTDLQQMATRVENFSPDEEEADTKN